MIQQSTFDFLKKLKKNNNKEWFDTNRKLYDAAKKDLLENVEGILANISKWDNRYAVLDPKKCIFRINRDMRFSADKSPYKTNMGAWFDAKGKNSSGPGYYLHIQPGDSFLAGGIYMPMPPELKAIRQEIDYNLKEYESILKNKDFKKYFGEMGGEKLKTTPKEYDKDNPAIEHLKHKSYVVMHKITDAEMTNKDFLKYVDKVFKAMVPMNNFLARAVSNE